MKKFGLAVALVSTLSFPINSPLAQGSELGNPILHEVRIDDDTMQATLIWSTSTTSDDDDIDDYAYTTDGFNYISLFGSYNSGAASESQTLTIKLPARANAKSQTFAIGKVRDNRITSSSNVVRAKISEQPVPINVQLSSSSGGVVTYKITNFNRTAVDNGAIRYKVSQIKAAKGSKVRISLQDELISVSGFAQGEKIAFRTIKYVILCDGFSPFLSCPYNAKFDTKIDWNQVSALPPSK
jgi:hypothetical protein